MLALSDAGYPVPISITDPQQRIDFAYNTLLGLLSSNKALVVSIIGQVPYNQSADAPAYTQGLIDFFMRNQPASTVTAQQRFDVTALLGGLGQGLSTFTGISLANQGTNLGGTGTTQTAQQQAAALAATQEAAKRKTYMIIGFAVLGLIVLGIVIYFVTKGDEPKASSGPKN